MNDNTRYKIALWQTLSANAAALESRAPLTLAAISFISGIALVLGMLLRSYVLIYLVPPLILITINIASSGMRKAAVIRGYLRHIENEINDEMQSKAFLWNLEAADKYYSGSLPGVLTASLSLTVAVIVFGYIIIYMLFIRNAQAFADNTSNLIFKIFYIIIILAAAIATVIGFLGNYAAADNAQKMMDGDMSPADENWKPPFDES